MIQNLATQKMLQALKEQIMKEQFDEKYPVSNGHYVQFQGMAEPSVAFAKYGATWQIDTDYTGRVLVGSGTGFTIGATGGEATHTLNVPEMPNHLHRGLYWGAGKLENPLSFDQNDSGVTGILLPINWQKVEKYEISTTGDAGGGQPHNNMQPYKVVAVWKRTA